MIGLGIFYFETSFHKAFEGREARSREINGNSSIDIGRHFIKFLLLQ